MKHTITLLAFIALAGAAKSVAAPDRISFIDNGQPKVGVDQDLGGAITWLSAPGHDNLINNADWGRQIQLSFYSGPQPFEPDGQKAHPHWKNWAWNPIQSGDVYRNRAKVVDLTNTGTEMRLTSIPLQWALNNVPGDCRYEARLVLDGPMLKVHYKLINQRTDTNLYGGFNQELPAIYTVTGLTRLMTYSGDKPFSGGALTRIENDWKQKFPWTRFLATEGWVAAVGDDDWGIGVCNPEVYNYLGGRHGGPNTSWVSTDGPTMYISPVSTDVLDHDIVFEFDVAVRVGKLNDLRDYFTTIMSKLTPPAWDFARDRQHWVPKDCTDAGWPIKDGLHLTTTKGLKPHIEGPIHPFRAETAPKLRITGTWKGLKGTGHVTWKVLGNDNPAKPLSASFPIPEAGNETTVEVDLAAQPEFRGLITQLTVCLADMPVDGGEVVVRSITTGWRSADRSLRPYP
jgi:hypothetical protein